jgi:ankyrin repeat protein
MYLEYHRQTQERPTTNSTVAYIVEVYLPARSACLCRSCVVMNADAVFKLVRKGDAAELASFLESHANVNLNAKNSSCSAVCLAGAFVALSLLVCPSMGDGGRHCHFCALYEVSPKRMAGVSSPVLCSALTCSSDTVFCVAHVDKGQTPLYWACELQDPACCELLVKHG